MAAANQPEPSLIEKYILCQFWNVVPTNEKTALAADKLALQGENDTLAADKLALQEENRTLAAEKRALKEENTTLAAEKRALKEENTALVANLDKKEQEKQQLDGEVARLHVRVKMLEDNLEDAKSTLRKVDKLATSKPTTPASSSSVANHPSTLPGPPADWTLMDRVDALRQLANKLHLSHESRPNEGSFAFRRANTNLLLVLTEFVGEEKVRIAIHGGGSIRKERYYPKVDWQMFAQTLRGIIHETFLDGE